MAAFVVVVLEYSDVAGTAAVVAARLHRALRHHDSCSVVIDREALVASALISREEKVGKETERRRAQYLEHLAIPPASGPGTWSQSAVRRFRA